MKEGFILVNNHLSIFLLANLFPPIPNKVNKLIKKKKNHYSFSIFSFVTTPFHTFTDEIISHLIIYPMHIKHHPTFPSSPFIPWTILTVLFNTLNLIANYSTVYISNIQSCPVKRAVAIFEDDCRESCSSGMEGNKAVERWIQSQVSKSNRSRGALPGIFDNMRPRTIVREQKAN